MNDIPQKLKEVMHNPKLRKTVEHQPGSPRFKATVLGLVSLSQVKKESEGRNDHDFQD